MLRKFCFCERKGREGGGEWESDEGIGTDWVPSG
jgi:hypothetical protein